MDAPAPISMGVLRRNVRVEAFLLLLRDQYSPFSLDPGGGTMRILLGVLMVLHGIAHLPGFVNEWRLANLEGISYRTTILAGRLDLGDAGIRVVGALWLLAAVAFCVTGVAALGNASWWLPAAGYVAAGSLLLSLVELAEARLGLAVNVVILAGLVIAARLAAP